MITNRIPLTTETLAIAMITDLASNIADLHDSYTAIAEMLNTSDRTAIIARFADLLIDDSSDDELLYDALMLHDPDRMTTYRDLRQHSYTPLHSYLMTAINDLLF